MKEYRLSDVMHIIGGGTPKTSIPEYWNGDIPWLSVVDFGNDLKYVHTTEKAITSLGLAKSSTKLLPEGSLIISARDTVGEIAMLKKEMAFNQSCYGLIAKEQYCTNHYLYYLIKLKISELKRKAYGAVFDTITRQTFETITVNLPSISKQQEIAEILSSLDDKIELNNKINAELENLADTLFHRWVVSFKFPTGDDTNYIESGGQMVRSELGDIPVGWEVRRLDQIATFLNGLALQKFPATDPHEYLPVIKIKELRQGHTVNSDRSSSKIDPKYVVEDGDVLFAWSGSLMVDVWTGGRGALNQHLFKVDSNKFSKWFYLCWIKFHLSEFKQIAESKATTMGHIQRRHLSDAKVLVPDTVQMKKFDGIFDDLLSKRICLKEENHKLRDLRDTLINKLIY